MTPRGRGSSAVTQSRGEGAEPGWLAGLAGLGVSISPGVGEGDLTAVGRDGTYLKRQDLNS